MRRLCLYCLNALAITVLLLNQVKSQCDFGTPDGTYRAVWYLDQSTSLIKFLIQVNQRQRKSFWTGVGFGNQMRGADMILITVKDNRLTISDRHSTENKEPIEDKQQDAKNFNGHLIDGILTAEFSRAVDTGDKEDLPLMDREKGFCQDFMFPLSGGTLDLSNEQKPVMLKHFQIPVIRRMCNIDQCLSPDLRTTTQLPPTTEPPTPELRTPPPPPPPTRPVVIINNVIEPDNTRIIPAPTQRPIQSPQIETFFTFQPERPPPLPTEARNIVVHPVTEHAPTMGMCSFSEGDYDVKWTYNATLRSVAFSIDAMLSFNKWTGIGFGRTMQPGDMILLYDGNGLVEVSDRHSNSRSEPIIDSHQDIEFITVNYNGDRVQAQFSRRVNTGDFEDIPLEDPSLNGCQYFIFPISGGPLIPSTNGGRPQIGKHLATPRVKLICGLSKCVPGAPETFVPIDINPQFIPPLPNTEPPQIIRTDPPVSFNRNDQQNVQPQRNFNQQPNARNIIADAQQPLPRPTVGVPTVVLQNNNFVPPLLPQNIGQPLQPAVPQNLPGLLSPADLSPNFLPNSGGLSSQIGGSSAVLPQNGGFIPPLPLNSDTSPGVQQQHIGSPPGQSQNPVPQQSPVQITVQPPPQLGSLPQQHVPVPPLPSNAPLPRNNKPDGHRGVQCPTREDHNACKVYIDDYFAIVFAEFPRLDLITQKACIILADHQDGIVFTECCHYLNQVCGKYL